MKARTLTHEEKQAVHQENVASLQAIFNMLAIQALLKEHTTYGSLKMHQKTIDPRTLIRDSLSLNQHFPCFFFNYHTAWITEFNGAYFYFSKGEGLYQLDVLDLLEIAMGQVLDGSFRSSVFLEQQWVQTQRRLFETNIKKLEAFDQPLLLSVKPLILLVNTLALHRNINSFRSYHDKAVFTYSTRYLADQLGLSHVLVNRYLHRLHTLGCLELITYSDTNQHHFVLYPISIEQLTLHALQQEDKQLSSVYHPVEDASLLDFLTKVEAQYGFVHPAHVEQEPLSAAEKKMCLQLLKQHFIKRKLTNKQRKVWGIPDNRHVYQKHPKFLG